MMADLLMMPELADDVLSEVSRLAHHWESDRLSLDTVAGEAATFARAGTKSCVDSQGTSRTVNNHQPAWEAVDLDSDSVRESPGLLMGSTDTIWWPFLRTPGQLSALVEFVERGSLLTANAGVLYIGNDANSGWRLYIDSTGSQYRATLTDGATTRQSTMSGTAPTSGQRVRLRLNLTAAGVVTLHQTIGAGSETNGNTPASLTPGAAWSDTRLRLNSRGTGNVGSNLFFRSKVALQSGLTLAQLEAAF